MPTTSAGVLPLQLGKVEPVTSFGSLGLAMDRLDSFGRRGSLPLDLDGQFGFVGLDLGASGLGQLGFEVTHRSANSPAEAVRARPRLLFLEPGGVHLPTRIFKFLGNNSAPPFRLLAKIRLKLREPYGTHLAQFRHQRLELGRQPGVFAASRFPAQCTCSR